MARISSFELLFWGLELPIPTSSSEWNGSQQPAAMCVFEKKSIVCHVESFVFKKSLAVDYPSFGHILFFVMAYEAGDALSGFGGRREKRHG